MEKQDQTFETWAIVELFGRSQLAGLVTEQVIAGQGFIRVDVPAVAGRGGFTRLFGPGAIYSIIPTDEQTARRFVAKNFAAPIQPWQLAQLPEPAAPASQPAVDLDDDEEDDAFLEDEDDDIFLEEDDSDEEIFHAGRRTPGNPDPF